MDEWMDKATTFLDHAFSWTFHSESGTRVVAEDEYDCDVGDVDRMDGMLEAIEVEVTEDPPTAEVKAFFKLRKSRFMNTLK
jgi:hypothetical protein